MVLIMHDQRLPYASYFFSAKPLRRSSSIPQNMVKVLPPYKPDPPPAYVPGMAVSVAPSPHANFPDDYEYYDQLGRDPLQQRFIWGIKDDADRLAAFEEMLEEFPKQVHRRQILFKAVRRGDEVISRRLVETGMRVVPDLDAQRRYEEAKEAREAESGGMEVQDEVPDVDDPTCSPLHLAATGGHFGILKMFVESDVDVNAVDEFNRTPLIAASHCGRVEIMRYLLDKGADPMARTSNGSLAEQYMERAAGANALEIAALKGKVEALQLLLGRFTNGVTPPQMEDEERERSELAVTPLAIQNAAFGSLEALQYLLAQAGYPLEGSDVKTKGELLSTEQIQVVKGAIEVAASGGSLSSLKLLLSYLYSEADIDNATFTVPEEWHESWTRGAYGTLEKDDAEKLAYLYSFGIQEHATMSMDPLPDGQTLNIQHLLELAAEHGAMNCARLLIDKYGAEVNRMRVPPACFPLFFATWRNRTDMVRYLLEECGADIHKGSGSYAAGPTALWSAISLKALESIECLLRHGGPVDAVDPDLANAIASRPVTAILQATTMPGAPVRLDLEDNVKAYVNSCRRDFQELNPMYVRIELGPHDQDLLQRLVPRLSRDELRDGIRAIDFLDDSELTGAIRNKIADWPTDQKRLNELEADEDVLPQWKPFLVPVSHRT